MSFVSRFFKEKNLAIVMLREVAIIRNEQITCLICVAYFSPLITLIFTNNKLVKISVISGEINLCALSGSLRAQRNTYTKFCFSKIRDDLCFRVLSKSITLLDD